MEAASMHAHGSQPDGEQVADEELMRQLAAGRQEALGALYARHARRVFEVAAQTLDRPSAEEIVQDVFLAVWREAASFSPERGTFRGWVLQIAHFRVLNELRRRSRRPQAEPDPEGLRLAGLPDRDPEPAELAWREQRRAALRAALEHLPAAQRQALGLAFFDELTHEQVAEALHLPLGTAKTRIRSGLQKLRVSLAPLVAALALAIGGTLLGLRYLAEQAAYQRDERALALVTTSDTQQLRLTAVPGVPDAAHAVYRGRAGTPLAVLTLSNVPPLRPGQTYQAWAQHAGRWTSLGTLEPGPDGHARLIAEAPELASLPDALEVTLEPTGGSATPSGPTVVTWTGS